MFLISSNAIWAFLFRYINIIGLVKLKKIIYITKTLMFLSNTALANIYSSISSTYLVVGKALAVVQKLQISFFLVNWIFILLSIKKTFRKPLSNQYWVTRMLLKKPSFFNFIFYLKACQDYFKYFNNRTMNFISSHIGVAELKDQFYCVC